MNGTKNIEKKTKIIIYKDFESGDDISYNDTYKGKGSLEVKGGKIFRINNVPLEENKTYKVSFAIKKDKNISKKRGSNQLIIFNQPRPKGRVYLINGVGMWKPADEKWYFIEKVFTTKDKNINHPLLLMLNKNSTASLWIDELKIEEIIE